MNQTYRSLLFGIVSYCSMVSCSESTSPTVVIGKYAFESFSTVSVVTGDTTDNVSPPLLPVITEFVLLDSLRDTIILAPNSTYREVGAVWGTGPSSSEPKEFPINVTGTYFLDGTAITLVPNEGSVVAGGEGILKRGKLMFDRYPGSWTFQKK